MKKKTIVGEYTSTNNELVNIATSFCYRKNDNSHTLKWKSFKCILYNCHGELMMIDDQQRHCTEKFYIKHSFQSEA